MTFKSMEVNMQISAKWNIKFKTVHSMMWSTNGFHIYFKMINTSVVAMTMWQHTQIRAHTLNLLMECNPDSTAVALMWTSYRMDAKQIFSFEWMKMVFIRQVWIRWNFSSLQDVVTLWSNAISKYNRSFQINNKLNFIWSSSSSRNNEKYKRKIGDCLLISSL